MLNVLMAASSFPSDNTDWKGRFIYDMAESVAASEQLELSLWAPPGVLPERVTGALAGDDAQWLAQMLAKGGIAHLLRQHPLKGAASVIGLLFRLRKAYRVFAEFPECTAVVHANWLQTALPLFGTKLPALITVLGSDLGLLKLPCMPSMLRRVMRQRAVILAPNAEWMVPELERRFGDVAEIRTIPFGIHARWFNVKRSNEAPASGDWLVVSRITKNKLGYLLEWGEGIFGEVRRLHLLGPMQEDIRLPGWVRYHGSTNPEELASRWFPNVQGLLTLSQHDEGRPQVMLEAMAAGLPIIASELPAHRDLLGGGNVGYLVRDSDELLTALNHLEDPSLNVKIGGLARGWVRETIGTWEDCANRYVNAYCDLLKTND